MVTLDCASLTETLIESQLFGHVRGAFTGADRRREGLILQAHQGTLFLDEVGELPMPMQRAFLRVLEQKRFRPVGSEQELESDFRLLAATNKDLDEMAGLGLFRPDLLYRLRGLTITLPPLRERSGDLPQLCSYFLDGFCQRYQTRDKRLSDDFLDTLAAYGWPGNVRELAHALERAFVAGLEEPMLYARHLPTELRVAVARKSLRDSGGRKETGPAAQACPVAAEDGSFPSLREYRDRAEARYLDALLERTKGNVTEAADLAGLSRGHLYEVLKKHGKGRN
jgi:two-component system NtrC family response regulator